MLKRRQVEKTFKGSGSSGLSGFAETGSAIFCFSRRDEESSSSLLVFLPNNEDCGPQREPLKAREFLRARYARLQHRAGAYPVPAVTRT